MQKSLGGLEQAVNRLVESEGELKKKLGRVELVMYAAGIVLAIMLAIGGWMLNTAKDFAMEYYKASLEAQKQAITIPATPLKK